MTQHTPGPFCAGELACGCRVLVARDDLGERRDSVYCQIHDATPELLDLLRFAVANETLLSTPKSLTRSINSARAAIRAATGGA